VRWTRGTAPPKKTRPRPVVTLGDAKHWGHRGVFRGPASSIASEQPPTQEAGQREPGCSLPEQRDSSVWCAGSKIGNSSSIKSFRICFAGKSHATWFSSGVSAMAKVLYSKVLPCVLPCLTALPILWYFKIYGAPFGTQPYQPCPTYRSRCDRKFPRPQTQVRTANTQRSHRIYHTSVWRKR
jgi:hypothetical protein